MKINGEKIAQILLAYHKKTLKKIGKKPTLAVVLVGQSPEQLSFVKIKEKIAKKLGIKFLFYHLKKTPFFEAFMHKIKEIANDPKINGLVIQQPLPSQLDTLSLYDYINPKKEIEGFSEKSLFLPPIGQAVLTVIKFIYLKTQKAEKLMINSEKDLKFFKKILKNKKIILVGTGKTGGTPIGKTLNFFKINYLVINSKTTKPEKYLKEADIIISAVGKNVIEPNFLKPGVILINVGLRRENNRLKGDYEEKEIKEIASFYTPTPGGIGPIDVACLYKNLIDALKKE